MSLYYIIDHEQALVELCQKLQNATVLALDTEFIREKTFFPQLEIIQVANENPEDPVWIIDYAVLVKKKANFQPWIEILKNQKIQKIFHAAQADQECFFLAFNVTASPSMDTAVAASMLGMGENLSLKNLLKETVHIEVPKGLTRTRWDQRPLPDNVLKYAALDVRYLIEAFSVLSQKLEEKKRLKWAFEKSKKWEDSRNYSTTPEEYAVKVLLGKKLKQKELSAAFGLLMWRENRARQLNLPRKWVAEDSVLLDLARVHPATEQELNQFRGIPPGELRNQSRQILKAMEITLTAEILNILGQSHFHKKLTDVEEQILLGLQIYFKILGDRFGISPRHLMGEAKSLNDFIPLCRAAARIETGAATRIETGAESGGEDALLAQLRELCGEQACEYLGTEMIHFLQGKLGFYLSSEGLQLR